MQTHLRDYVWMALPGSEPEKVEATTQAIGQKMAAGYGQVFPDDKSDETHEEGVNNVG